MAAQAQSRQVMVIRSLASKIETIDWCGVDFQLIGKRSSSKIEFNTALPNACNLQNQAPQWQS